MLPLIQRVNHALTALYSKLAPTSTNINDSRVITFNEQEIDRMYEDNFIIQNAVNRIPEDALMQEPLWGLDVPEGNSEIDLEEFRNKFSEIRTHGKPLEEIDITGGLRLAWQYARLTGDGFCFLGIDDGQDPREPVNEENIQGVTWMLVADRFHVHINYLTNRITYFPEGYYKIEGEENEDSEMDFSHTLNREFHISRVLRFSGIQAFSHTNSNGSFNLSIVGNVFNAYKNYLRSLNSSGDMIASHSAFKYGLKGLNQITQIGKEKAVKDRFESLLFGLNVFNGLVYDADSETADFINRSYTGIAPLLEHLQNWLVASSGMPRYKLLNTAPSGALSEGGKEEKKAWNEIIRNQQTLNLTYPLRKLAKYLLLGLGYKEFRIEINYSPYYPETKEEKAAIQKTQAETDTIRINSGVLSREEVRQSRYGGTNYGEEITLLSDQLPEDDQNGTLTEGKGEDGVNSGGISEDE